MYLTKQRRFYFFLSLILVILATSLLADYMMPFGPYDQNLTMALRPPDAIHWLGTDRYLSLIHISEPTRP